MRIVRSLVTVCTLLCLCLPHVQATTDTEAYACSSQEQVPLPLGRELGDAELLLVEGEIVWWLALIIYTAVAGVTGAGAAAIHENWLDEDYGIDRDDWRVVGYGAVAGAMLAASGGLTQHYVPMK